MPVQIKAKIYKLNLFVGIQIIDFFGDGGGSKRNILNCPVHRIGSITLNMNIMHNISLCLHCKQQDQSPNRFNVEQIYIHFYWNSQA